MAPYFYLDVNSTQVGAFIGVNHVPIVADPDGAGVRTLYPINDWLMPAGNELTAYLYWPEGKNYVPGAAKLEVRVFIANPDSEFPEPKEVLAEINWPLQDVPEQYPYTLAEPFEVEEPPPTKLWNEVQTTAAIGDNDRRNILELVEQFRQALMSRDSSGAFQRMKYRYEDDALANYKDSATIRNVVIKQYDQLKQLENLSSDPLDPAKVVFDIVAGKRLVLVSRAPGQAAVILRGGGKRFSIPVYVARINGEWTIVRG